MGHLSKQNANGASGSGGRAGGKYCAGGKTWRNNDAGGKAWRHVWSWRHNLAAKLAASLALAADLSAKLVANSALAAYLSRWAPDGSERAMPPPLTSARWAGKTATLRARAAHRRPRVRRERAGVAEHLPVPLVRRVGRGDAHGLRRCTRAEQGRIRQRSG
eukprot:gene14731-biopygen2783